MPTRANCNTRFFIKMMLFHRSSTILYVCLSDQGISIRILSKYKFLGLIHFFSETADRIGLKFYMGFCNNKAQ